MQEEWIFEFNVFYDILSCDSYGFVKLKTPSLVLKYIRLAVYVCMYVIFFTIKPTEALISKFNLIRNSTCFRQFLCPSSGVFHRKFGRIRMELQFHPDPARKLSSKPE
jgi:hypothetical protein